MEAVFVAFFEENLSVKKLSRPLPELNVSKVSELTQVQTRKFNSNIFLKDHWICGC